MFAVNFYASCFVSRGNSIGKKVIGLDWEKAVYRPLFTLANTLYWYCCIITCYKVQEEYWLQRQHLEKFCKDVCQFLSALTIHMIEKCPLKHLIICCSSCLNPDAVAVTSQLDVSKVKFRKILENLDFQSHISSKITDEAK